MKHFYGIHIDPHGAIYLEKTLAENHEEACEAMERNDTILVVLSEEEVKALIRFFIDNLDKDTVEMVNIKEVKKP